MYFAANLMTNGVEGALCVDIIKISKCPDCVQTCREQHNGVGVCIGPIIGGFGCSCVFSCTTS